VFGDINNEFGHKLEQEWKAQKSGSDGEIVFVPWDARKVDSCKNLVKIAIKKYSKIDVLINNVGVQPLESGVPIHLLDESIWDWLHDVNIKSYFLMSKEVIPFMMSRKSGSIINVSSIQGIQSQKGVSAYASTKGAILSLTRSLAVEYGKFNILVNSISPGTISTELAAMNTDYSYAISNTPMGKVGSVQDVAPLAILLASSSWITGKNFVIDGGITVKGGWADMNAKL